MKNISWLSQLKIRVSYGVTGNQSIDPYSTFSMYGSNSNLYYADGSGNAQTAFTVTNLSKQQFEMGKDGFMEWWCRFRFI